MNKPVLLILLSLLALSACGRNAPVARATDTFPPAVSGLSILAHTPTAIQMPSHTPGAPVSTATFTSPAPTPTDLPATTATPAAPDRPIFLAWPLPAYIGLARISQYPNTPWTWNYLGLNPGYQCPPMFGYLLSPDSWPYWRDKSIPEEQDQAQADPHNFEMVECYSTDDGPPGENGHAGTDIKAPAGTPVYAAADGLVQEWRLEGLYSMIVLKHCLGGAWDAAFQCAGGQQWYTTYMHIEPDPGLFQENRAVAQGTTVGTVYDQTINSHLHLEVGLDRRSYTNFVNPWGRDSAPWLGCMWLDQSLCVNPDPAYKRLAFYSGADRLAVVTGQGEMVEFRGAQGIRQIRLAGERLAAIDSNNNLRVWDGYATGQSAPGDLNTWAIAAEKVLDFEMTAQRIAMWDEEKSLWVKDGNLENVWSLQAANVYAFSLSDHRLGYLSFRGDLFIKEGGLENDWVKVARSVKAFQVVDNRIAILDRQDNLSVNEGGISAEFEQQADRVRAFQVANLRLGVIDREGNLQVKAGNLRAKWVLQAENAQAFQLADYRILMLGQDGFFRFKEGSLYQAWGGLPFADLLPDYVDVFLNGGMPVNLR